MHCSSHVLMSPNHSVPLSLLLSLLLLLLLLQGNAATALAFYQARDGCLHATYSSAAA
jgi:hypothetical protein